MELNHWGKGGCGLIMSDRSHILLLANIHFTLLLLLGRESLELKRGTKDGCAIIASDV